MERLPALHSCTLVCKPFLIKLSSFLLITLFLSLSGDWKIPRTEFYLYLTLPVLGIAAASTLIVLVYKKKIRLGGCFRLILTHVRNAPSSCCVSTVTETTEVDIESESSQVRF